ncbi:MAG: SIS domain-containing protein [Roseinatronobacter sp.]
MQSLHVIPTIRAEDVAARVLGIEAQAIATLASNLPEDFADAANLILASKGRLIVSGIGKSGHIGRKMAATFASTGTPSFFVHPAEASHGDLGMITPDDVCLVISNSGETSELGDVIHHCTRFRIPIIGISKRPESTLMRAARCRLTLPDLQEACSIGMAPTTSTTLTLAMGDALAVALMEMRGFKKENFGTYHPGGKLGAQLLKARQLMHEGAAVPCVQADHPMPEVIVEMTARGFGVAAVLDTEGRVMGVISDGDLRRNLAALMTTTAAAVCTRNPVTIGPDTLAPEALNVMNGHKIGALFVVDNENRPVGILHIHDLLRAGVV